MHERCQQAQLDNFRAKLHDYLVIDENLSFDDIAQRIVDCIIEEREGFNRSYTELKKANDDLRSGSLLSILRYFI